MSDAPKFDVQRSAFDVQRSGRPGGQAGSDQSASLITSDAPWPGLAPFTESQGAFFHGRDEEIDDLTQLARLRALVVLFGQSGLGKSSLLQAGVFPRLRANGFCPVYIRLDHSEEAPAPTEQIRTLLLAETSRVGKWTQPDVAKPGETLWELFHHRDDRLVGADGEPIIPVLVFDQFEELFTLGAAAGPRRDRSVAFMAELAELVENRPSEQLVARLEGSAAELDAFDFGRADYRVVITLREDYLPELEGMKTIMPALMANRMRLARMTGAQALEAVVKPGGALVTEDVARAIVEFVAGARGGSAERLAELHVEPPLLSVICRELNERRRALGQAQITAEMVTGNRREILTDFYERSVADLPEGMRRFVEDKLLTKSGFRDNLALETALDEPGVTRPLIDTLVARRLLRIEDRLGTQRVELTHDVLAEVIRASRDARQQRLAALTAKRAGRRMKWLVGGLAAAVVVLGLAVVVGLAARKREYQRMSRVDADLASRAFEEGKVSDGLAYLLRAAKRDPHNAVLASRLVSVLTTKNFQVPEGSPAKLGSRVRSLRHSDDGSKITVVCDDGTIGMIETATGRVTTRKLPAALTGSYGGVLTTGRLLSVLGVDGVLRVVNADNGEIEREHRFPEKVVAAWGRNDPKSGAAVMALFENQTALLYHADTGRTSSPFSVSAKVGTSWSINMRWGVEREYAGGRSIQFIDLETGDRLKKVPFDTEVRGSTFNRDGSRLLVTFLENKTYSWQMLTVPDGRPVLSAPVVVPDALWLQIYYVGESNTFIVRSQLGLQAYDGATAEKKGALIAGQATAAIWSRPDGGRIGLADSGDLRIWDTATGEPVTPTLRHESALRQVTFTPDGALLLTVTLEGYTRLWNATTGALLGEPTLQLRGARASLSPDQQSLAIASSDGEVYRLRRGRGAAGFATLPRTAQTWAWEPAGKRRDADRPSIYWIDGASRRRFELESGKDEVDAVLPGPVPETGVSVHPEVLIVYSQANRWEAWHVGDEQKISVVPLETRAPKTATRTVSVRHMRLALNYEQKVQVFNLQTGTTIGPEHEFPTPVWALDFNEDATRLATCTVVGVCTIWDVATGKSVTELKGFRDVSPVRIQFSRDGQRLLTTNSWGEVQVWNVANGEPISPVINHSGTVVASMFTQDGSRILTASGNNVMLWDATTGKAVAPPMQHPITVRRAGFNGSGERIISYTYDEARIWDVRTASLLAEPIRPNRGRVEAAIASRDTRFVVVSSRGEAETTALRQAWSIPPPMKAGSSVPAWLLDLAQLCGGKTVDVDGRFSEVANAGERFNQVRAELERLPADAPYAEWGRWFLSEDVNRPIAPGFAMTTEKAKELFVKWGVGAAPKRGQKVSAPVEPAGETER